MGGCPYVRRCTATTRSCCACRSWASPTASSPCSPAGTAGSGRPPRACAGPPPGSGPGWSRSATWTSRSPATRGPRAQPAHDPAGREHRAVRQAARPRLPPLHRGQRRRRDGRAAHPGRVRAGAAAVPADPGGAAGAVGRRARQHAGARRVPAAGDGDGRLGAGAGRVRGLRHPGPARRVRRPVRRRRSAPTAGRPARPARPRPRVELMIALTSGDWTHRRPQRGRPAPRVQWPGGGAPAVAPGARATLAAVGRPHRWRDMKRTRPPPSRRRRIRPAPARRRCRARRCPSTSRS